MTTKEKILDAAIDLFSQRGYREISVREIAKTVGIKASSLYKHYENKESILESIFAMFKEKISLTALSKEELERYVSGITPEQYLNDAFELFKSVMWSPETVKISKIITIEQQRNRSVREFFLREIIEKPTRMMKDALDLMKKNGTIDAGDTDMLAEEYSSYVIYLYFEQNFLKEELSFEEIDRKMKRHNRFYASEILKRREESK